MRCIAYSLTLIATDFNVMQSQESVQKMEPFGVYFDKICLTYLQRTLFFYM